MQEFIVLGIIPGTNYQTTFTFWVMVSAAIVIIPVLRMIWRRRYGLVSFGLSLYIAWRITRRRLPA